ncbi:MAG: cytochrome c peroxidase [Bacteriovorax sp.]|nr:cytochrome c peroxidase [Bacteriovorax sp.]
MKIIILINLFLIFNTANSEEKSLIDHYLRSRINHYNIRPLKNISKNTNTYQLILGERLFSDKILSGNKNISCQTCHNPSTGTTDQFPMSQTTDGKGILKRNAPALFNLGNDKNFMFWDGRIYYDVINKSFITPEKDLNGINPKAGYIVKSMKSALTAQALFPMVTNNEMKGEVGENEIANAKTNLEAWDLIVNRLMTSTQDSPNLISYQKLFKLAYPRVAKKEFNIAHIAEAIAAFESEKFQARDTPFERYLEGHNEAMTNEQKKGLIVFLDQGRCINCHQGSELGNNSLFASVATPQWGEVPLKLDKGRGDVTKDHSSDYFFRVPSLINVALTAPYMHNGSLKSLRDVINHYDHISKSLYNFKISELQQKEIPVKIEVIKSPLLLDDIWLSSQRKDTPKLKNKLFLTGLDKHYLESFLSEALTDSKWVRESLLPE